MTKPLVIDLFAGLGGWTQPFLDEGWDAVEFDIEHHVYGEHRYPAQLVIQDVRTLHGSQFRSADLIVASPPCQKYSYMAMPWSRGKAQAAAIEADQTGQLRAELNELFDACFIIQREACEAAGRHIPMIVENVRGAQRWVGRARFNFGSFYFWGDVPALMPIAAKVAKVPGFRFDGSAKCFQQAAANGFKAAGMNWSDQTKRGQDFTRIAGSQAASNKGVPHKPTGHWTNPNENGTKQDGTWFYDSQSMSRMHSSKSSARKQASAMIAKIPEPVARHIARVFKP